MLTNISPVDFEQFISLPENQDRLFELINGEIVEKMPTTWHGIIAGIIVTYLNLFLFKNPIGWATVEGRYKLPNDPHNDLIPDVSVFLKESAAVTKKGAAPHMPELVVEIKSPDDKLAKMWEKASYYVAHGVKIVWLVHTEKRLVYVVTPESETTLDENEMLDGGAVLPGFQLAVKDIFPKE